ncbi:hypothetical protein MVEN_00456300 [Mycena venus]|uniref:Uncharacterized protein n=1 Tax=Mycena venus TaxID=2733690 RepID=A0A8H6YV62_9AGAR|nr:hypothetical protein MVEN_00456300 [Mycena venus]
MDRLRVNGIKRYIVRAPISLPVNDTGDLEEVFLPEQIAFHLTTTAQKLLLTPTGAPPPPESRMMTRHGLEEEPNAQE